MGPFTTVVLSDTARRTEGPGFDANQTTRAFV